MARIPLPLPLLIVTVSLPVAGACAAEDRIAAQQGHAAIAGLGPGFVVWEARRDGDWRLWRRDLDGSGLRRISGDDDGEAAPQHYGPAVSPDGSRIVYASYPSGKNPYKDAGPYPLRVVATDGSDDRQLVAAARRGCGGNRFAIWWDEGRVCFMDGKGRPRLVDVESGEIGAPLLAEGRGYLVVPGGGFAFDRHHWHPVIDGRLAKTGEKFGGCESYATLDGTWGIRMAGAGGPISRYRLATGELSTILAKDDERMPPQRNYLYFPTTSPCGRLLAFAASPDDHNHWKSDYEIFVAAIDPATLELRARPVRFTFDPGTDRYPCVYAARFELGTAQGEAPFTWRVADDALDGPAAAWTWDYGDGEETDAAGRHTYAAAGTYAVTARRGEAVLRGEVAVVPRAAPELVDALPRGRRRVVLVFDEPVRVDAAEVSLESGIALAGLELLGDGRRLAVDLAGDLADEELIAVAGVVDRAQEPNRMEPTARSLRFARWPPSHDGLVFVWQHARTPDPLAALGHERPDHRLELAGRARPDRHFALRLAGGAARCAAADAELLARLQATDALTIEATLRPADLRQGGPARIVSFSRDSGSRNFTLGQQEDRLVLRLRTPRTGSNGNRPQQDLAPLRDDRLQHVLVSHADGRTRCWVDGEAVYDERRVEGDFRNWEPMRLVLGDEDSGGRDWAGTLEGVAIYDRAFDGERAAAHAAASRRLVEARAPVPRVAVEAELVATTPVPDPDEAADYAHLLVTCEYRLDEPRVLVPGEAPRARIRVVRYGLLDRRREPIAGAEVGERHRLLLEPFAAQPQLESLRLESALEFDPDRRRWFELR